MLLLLPTTSPLKRREAPPTVSSFSVSATTTAVSFASILLLLLLLRRDMHFCFLVEVLLLIIFFLVGCAAAAAGACAAYNISTEAERGTGYYFFLLRFCRLHCDASGVYCCCCSWLLRFLSLDCDVPVMVVDCAAVETGCMRKKCKMVAHLPAVLQEKEIYTYLVRIQNFLFHFPFDEIFRRLLFFTLGRSVSA